MGVIGIETFDESELNLQVRLDTCVDGDVAIDYTGKKSYTFGLMREGIGFGITGIDIDINASLQPVIEITFKDLYGNTLFGTQRVGGQLRGDNEGAFNKPTEIDYSVLFNWPPPKFYFTFKGFLGESVTWILNLKKTSTTFDSSDQSFVLKASFVPNQWGFFADMPFLFLLAVKSLKTKFGDGTVEPGSFTTLYDLIKIGKKVEVQKNETSKKFDALLNQISSYQSNLAGAIEISKVIKYDTEITGIVDGLKIDGFQPFQVVKPASHSTVTDKLDDQVKFFLNDASKFEKFTKFLATEATIFGDQNSEANKKKADEIRKKTIADIDAYDTDAKKAVFENVMQKIANNRRAIELKIQETTITTTGSELGKLTISNVLSKIAGDSGYILGRILEAGYGIFNETPNKTVSTTSVGDTGPSLPRDISVGEARGARNSPNLIGKHFPMMIKESKEVPATTENYGQDIGVDKYEMKFVKDFFTAISDGIVENRLSLDEASLNASQDSKVIKRVSNAEITQENPYKATYESITTNILERSGIISFITRSYDPNRPGNYGNTTNFQNDNKQNILKLANADTQNITEDLLKSVFDEDILKLKRFCLFFKNFFDSNGGVKTTNESGVTVPLHNPDSDEFNDPAEEVKESMNARVKTSDSGGETEVVNAFDFFREIETLLVGSQSTDAINEVGRFTSFYQLRRMVNNNVPYSVESDNEASDSNENSRNGSHYYMIRFEGSDVATATSANSSDTDGTKDSEHDDPNGVWDAEEPIGLVKVNSTTGEGGEVLGRVEYYDFDYAQNNKVYDFEKMKSAGRNYISKGHNSTPTTYQANQVTELDGRYFVDETGGEAYPTNASNTEFVSYVVSGGYISNDLLNSEELAENLPNGGMAFTIYYQADRSDNDDNIIWGPFLNTTEGVNQRRVLWALCNNLYEKLQTEDQRRRELVGTILGNASEQQDVLYKQFHLLFNQWNLLAYKNQDFLDTSKKRPNICLKQLGGTNIANYLEKLFGDKEKHLDVSGVRDPSLPSDTTFRYDYPMNSIGENGNVKVSEALINIDPLYSPKANTTVLNAIQQICQKNNFIFIPIPGNADYRNVGNIYKPNPAVADINIRNYFHVMFAPTPERRVQGNEGSTTPNNSGDDLNIQVDAIQFEFGSIRNKVVKSLNVSTDENKMTAESIVNLQRLVDNENRNKKVTTDCSMIPVLEGRSYKATAEVLGNAQIYPMQYFFVPKMPLFGGLYQIMKVKHKIEPNNMTTTVEGLKILSAGGKYGGQPPVTLKSLQAEIDQVNVVDNSNTNTNTNNT